MAAARITVTQGPAVVDLAVYQGDDVYLDMIVLDGAGASFDLAGYTARSQMRPTPPSDVTAAELICTIEAPNIIHIRLAHIDSANLKDVHYSWDVQITRTADGLVTTLAAGAVTVAQEVTR